MNAPFAGLSHAEVLATEFQRERFLVEDLIPVQGVGTYAGVPETHKSWLAQATAVRVAAGAGEILGHPVSAQANVGYWWQDDSTADEAGRVKLFEAQHPSPPELPVTWFLNEGLKLPRDLDALADAITSRQLGLVILDSFYNVAEVDSLKDDAAERIIVQLKELTDAHPCAVIVVDHMKWADEQRARLRAYGGVFKNAATRFGIYVDAQGKKLYAEARGNNIKGFKLTPCYWDAEALELRLVDVKKTDAEELEARVLDWVTAHPGDATDNVAAGVKKRRKTVAEVLERLEAAGRLEHKPSGTLGRPGTGHYWFPLNHAGSEPSQNGGTPQQLGIPTVGEPSQPSAPCKGGRLTGGTAQNGAGAIHAADEHEHAILAADSRPQQAERGHDGD
jgi:hypothetical protein